MKPDTQRFEREPTNWFVYSPLFLCAFLVVSVPNFLLYSEEGDIYNPPMFLLIALLLVSLLILYDVFQLKAIELASEEITFIYNHKSITHPVDQITFRQVPTEGLSPRSTIVFDGPGRFHETIMANNWMGYITIRNRLFSESSTQ